MDDSLRLRALSKAMQGFRLEASFEVGSGQRIAIVGRSGIGKTTLLRLIAGLEALTRGDAGEIWLAGREVTRAPVQRREIGFVFQEQALFDGRTVGENVEFGLRMRGVQARERRELAAHWLERLGLGGREGESVDHLSGGERQRVALARALIVKPKLILMDEPFTGLDSGLRDALCEEVLSLHGESRVPMLFVSHDDRELAKLATGTIVFEEIAGPQGPLRRAVLSP